MPSPMNSDVSLTTPGIQYLCDHFRALEAMWLAWCTAAVPPRSGGEGNDVEAEQDGVDTDIKDHALQQKAIVALATVFRRCYADPVLILANSNNNTNTRVSDLDATPVLSRNKKSTNNNNSGHHSHQTKGSNRSSTTGDWGCYDDAVADDDEAPMMMMTLAEEGVPSGRPSVGGKRSRDGNTGAVVVDDSRTIVSDIFQLLDLVDVGDSRSRKHKMHHRQQKSPQFMASVQVLSKAVAALREGGGCVPDETGLVPGRPIIIADDSSEGGMGGNNSPLYDLFILNQFLPLFGLKNKMGKQNDSDGSSSDDEDAEEEPPIFSKLHPLAAWACLCEVAEEGGGVVGSSSMPLKLTTKELSTIASAQQAGTCSLYPLSLLLPLVVFAMYGFNRLRPLERRLLQLLRRERRAGTLNAIHTTAASQAAAAFTSQPTPVAAATLGRCRSSAVAAITADTNPTAAPTPSSASTKVGVDSNKSPSTASYVKSKRGCLSLVCDDEDSDDDEDDEDVNQSASDITTKPPSVSSTILSSSAVPVVSKVLDYALSQDEDGLRTQSNLGKVALVTPIKMKGEVSASHHENDDKTPVLVPPTSATTVLSSHQQQQQGIHVATPLSHSSIARPSIIEISDTTSPPRPSTTTRNTLYISPAGVPRPPRGDYSSGSSSSSSSSDSDDGGHVPTKIALKPTPSSLLGYMVPSDGDDEDDVQSLPVVVPSGNDTKNSANNNVSDDEEDDEGLLLCSDSSEDSADGGATSSVGCAKCKSTKGDRLRCPRCSLYFHEKCGGPHPQEEVDAHTAEIAKLTRTISMKDLSKKDVYARIAGDFWGGVDRDDGEGDSDDGDDGSPQYRRLALAAGLVCMSCCGEQGLSGYREEPDTTPSHSSGGSSSGDSDDDDDDLSTDSSDIRAAEREDALDITRVERELARVKGKAYDPLEGKVTSDMLLLTQGSTNTTPSHKPIPSSASASSRRRDRHQYVPDIDKDDGEDGGRHQHRRRGCKYVISEAKEGTETTASDASDEGDEGGKKRHRRQKAEKGFAKHKLRTEKRVKRIREERRRNREEAEQERGGGSGGGVRDVVVISPDSSQQQQQGGRNPFLGGNSSGNGSGSSRHHHPRGPAF